MKVTRHLQMAGQLGVILNCLAFFGAVSVSADEFCLYKDARGVVAQTNARGAIPTQYQESAQCFPTKNREAITKTLSDPKNLAKPEQMELSGVLRSADLSTPLGPVSLRWTLKAEERFGKAPERAMADATQAVARALRSASFDARVQSFTGPLNTVFLDAELPAGQVPAYLISACHPGWMTPPGNIYVVGERAAVGCSGGSVSRAEADARLAAILVHEIGHAVEYALLGPSYRSNNRIRAEGFACWFEQYAAQYSSAINASGLRSYYAGLARNAFLAGKQKEFRGSAEDYAVAATFFQAVVARRGVAGLMEVYRAMREQNLDFIPAITSVLGWSERKILIEAARTVGVELKETR